MSALLNLDGGIILLGIEDDGAVSGLSRSRKQAELWTMNIARENLQPAPIPVWSTFEMEEGRLVGVIELAANSPEKPYKAKTGSEWVTYTRVGTTVRRATREEESRLYQAAGMVRYEMKPVLDMKLESLDLSRLENYFMEVLNRSAPERSDAAAWQQLLLNSDLLVRLGNEVCASVAGLLLFGRNPNRRLPQAGVTATAFPGKAKEYNTVDEERIRGPLTARVAASGDVVDRGVIERTVDFVKRNMGTSAWLDGARRVREFALPDVAIRETVVNALVHRDYTREGTDVEVSLYADRLEVISPGKLPNGVTVEKMREGVVRVARNELLKEILRDYRYIEHRGMGVRHRIIESMREHSGREPDLIEQDDRFIVRLWKKDLSHIVPGKSITPSCP